MRTACNKTLSIGAKSVARDFGRLNGTSAPYFFARPQFKSCKIRGAKGTLYWNTDSNDVKIFYNNQKKWKVVFKPKKFERNQMFVKELDYFLKYVKNKNKTFNDITEGKKTLQVILGAKKSSQFKKTIRLRY